MNKRLRAIYSKIYAAFGPQHWWPAKTPFEVIVGAILTQNTSWINVEKAIQNLKERGVLEPKKLYALPHWKLASFIKPAGYYNIKAKRLKSFLCFLFDRYGADLKRMARQRPEVLRQQLLCVNGVGPETADSILLYAFGKPVFVIDAYTKRIFSRHRFINAKATYDEMQRLFTEHLEPDAAVFNEFHALLVRVGKEFCLKTKPRCSVCPLNGDFL